MASANDGKSGQRAVSVVEECDPNAAPLRQADSDTPSAPGPSLRSTSLTGYQLLPKDLNCMCSNHQNP